MQLQARRAAAIDGYGKSGFFYPTEVAYRVFPPLTQLQKFSSYKYISFPPYDGVVCIGQQDPYQMLIEELLLINKVTCY